MGKFVCKECGYKIEKTEKLRVCPYCNKESLEEEQDAEKLVEEIEEILDYKL